MKITKDMVGKKVCKDFWDKGSYLEILFVGESQFFAKDQAGLEYCLSLIQHDWELYEEPKKVVKLAPALITNTFGQKFVVSHILHRTEEEAKKWHEDLFVKWPANDNMWVEVEVLK